MLWLNHVSVLDVCVRLNSCKTVLTCFFKYLTYFSHVHKKNYFEYINNIYRRSRSRVFFLVYNLTKYFINSRVVIYIAETLFLVCQRRYQVFSKPVCKIKYKKAINYKKRKTYAFFFNMVSVKRYLRHTKIVYNYARMYSARCTLPAYIHLMHL